MPTLKEIKGRISSVKNTLKITSAMKLVSSAKLRKAQKATEAMRPYEAQLQRMLSQISIRKGDAFPVASAHYSAAGNASPSDLQASPSLPTAIIAVASNSSLCGGFNANVIAQVRHVRKKGDVVYSVGRKMADAMRKDGFPSPEDYSALADHPEYGPASALADRLARDLEDGRIGRVVLVYTHFVSTARQVPVEEILMSEGSRARDFSPAAEDPSSPLAPQDDKNVHSEDSYCHSERSEESSDEPDLIIEPSRKELLEILEPKVVKLKLYAALLDSAAAEHAARTVAMQTATDNGEQLLDDLTLQYNKGRQQKITNEILDLATGQVEG